MCAGDYSRGRVQISVRLIQWLFLAFVLVFTCLELKYRLETLTVKPGRAEK